MASADDESPKANDDGNADKKAPSSAPPGLESQDNLKSLDTSENKNPIKRVKANTLIAKTRLEVDALKNGASELIASSQDAACAEPPGNSKPGSLEPSPESAKAAAATTNATTVQKEPEPNNAPLQVSQNTQSAETSLSPINRVKANAAIARTKIDLDACRDVAFNTVEEQVEKFREVMESQAAVPVKEFKPIDRYRKASPCSSLWETMTGATGCMKFCEQCQLMVYDFSKLELAQAEQIILQREDKDKNFILYRRADGKFLARDCPVGAKRKQIFLVGLLVSISAVSCVVYYFVSQANTARTVVAKKPLLPVQEVAPAPRSIESPELAEPETKSTLPTKLKKSKVSFDRAGFLKRINDLKKNGKNTRSYEDALHKIDVDIDAGKHPLMIEPQIQELGENIGLLKREVPVAASAPAKSIVLNITRNQANEVFSAMGFAAGFASQPPAVIADVDPYITAKFSDSLPLAVTEVLGSSVAEQAGLRPGQRIMSLNGLEVEGLRLAQIRSILQGEAATKLVIGVQTARGSTKSLVLVRR